MFLNIVADSKNNAIEDDLFDQLLLFMIQLLEGGNPKGNFSFSTKLTNSLKNYL